MHERVREGGRHRRGTSIRDEIRQADPSSSGPDKPEPRGRGGGI